MDAPHRSAETLTPLVGDCVVSLRHSTSYEPPMYLFPELLPRAPAGAGAALSAISASDALADAVDVEASSLSIATLFHLSSPLKLNEGEGGEQRGADMTASPTGTDAGEVLHKNITTTTTPPPMTSLASLVASNQLQLAGLSPDVLQRGKFSSESLLQEISKLADRLGLNENKSKPLFSNQFINLLAWKKVCEINSNTPLDTEREEVTEWRNSRVRSRVEAEETIDIASLQPSIDPWSSSEELQPGLFIAAAERNVERRIEIVNNLNALYRRPWRTLQSQGVQTERFNPGRINETAPFADPMKLPGAMLNAKNLGLKTPSVQDATNCHWVIRIKSLKTKNTEVIPMQGKTMNFGRNIRVSNVFQGFVTTAHVDLSTLTDHPEYLSSLHFSLVVLPSNSAPLSADKKTSNNNRNLESTCTTCIMGHHEGSKRIKLEENNNNNNNNNNNEEEENGNNNNENGDGSQSDLCLCLVNYGRNGTRVVGKQWILGNILQLEVGDVLRPVDDIHITIDRPVRDKEEKMMETEEEEEEEAEKNKKNDDDNNHDHVVGVSHHIEDEYAGGVEGGEEGETKEHKFIVKSEPDPTLEE